MKKIFFLLLTVFAFNACHYVDIDPENTPGDNDIDYSQTSNMYQAVVGPYYKLRNLGMHWALNMIWTGSDDDLTSGRTDDQGDALRFGYRGGYICPNSFWALNLALVNPTMIIRTCNEAIIALDKYAEYITQDSNTVAYAQYQQYVGEVKTIRAWCYYMLVTTFGDCVILYDNNQERYIRTKREKVCQYVIEDLENSIPNMERKRPNEMEHKGAYTAYTAEALVARFALLIGDYEKVEKMTDDIIKDAKFQLYPDYYNLFKPNGNLCDESLMEVQVHDDGGEIIYGIDQWYNYMGASVSGKNDKGEEKTIAGWTFMRYNPDFLAWAKERKDSIRIVTSFLQGGTKTVEGWTVNADSNVIFNGKAYIPYTQLPSYDLFRHNNNVRLLRYAEVLLMNAEAKVKLGKNGDDAINEVRSRAGLTPLSNATIEQILDERRMELCSEWRLRYTDLVRTGMAATVLNDPKLVRDFGSGEWTEAKAYWPVPGTQLAITPDLALDPQ